MKLYLSSYRIGNNTKELKNWIENNGNKILVIPNALDTFPDSERKSNGIMDKIRDLTEIGFDAEILDLRNFFNNSESLKERLKNAKAFYVLGGNVFVLRTAMKLSGFDIYLREIATEPDYLYSGFSSGICVLAKDLHGINLADNEKEDPYNYGETIWGRYRFNWFYACSPLWYTRPSRITFNV